MILAGIFSIFFFFLLLLWGVITRLCTVFQYLFKYIYISICLLYIVTLLTVLNFVHENIVSNFFYITIFKHSNIWELFFFKLVGFWSTVDGSIFLLYAIAVLVTLYFLYFCRNFNFFFFFGTFFFMLQCFFWGGYVYLFANPLLGFVNLKFYSLQLNPLLQDFILAIHPPVLYFGYIVFLCFFAFVFFFLKYSVFGFKYFVFINNIFFLGWIFLTFGIFLGSWWAYYELGWGGWWFWDPVENISLLPWLLTVVYIHFYVLSKQNPGLIIFLLYTGLFIGISIFLGFFFVRAGLLFSVHNFVSDFMRSSVILILLLYFLINSFFLGIRAFFYIKSYITLRVHFILLVGLFGFLCVFLFLFFSTFINTLLAYFFTDVLLFTFGFFNEFFSTVFFVLFLYLLVYFLNFFTIKFNLIFVLLCVFFYVVFLTSIFYVQQYFFLFVFLMLFLCLLLFFLFVYFVEYRVFLVIHGIFLVFAFLIFFYSFISFDFFSIFLPGDYYFFLKNFLLFRGTFIFNTYNYFSLWGNFILLDWSLLTVLAVFFTQNKFYFLEKMLNFKFTILSNYLSDFVVYLGDGSLLTGWYVHFFYNFGMPLLWCFFLLLCFAFLFWLRVQYLKICLTLKQILFW